MVSSGRSNRDVAGALHLSSRTVEYHLSKVYVKLGLDSRDQLAGALAD
jgi:DNA-binding CsgD family transcriptional regulator